MAAGTWPPAETALLSSRYPLPAESGVRGRRASRPRTVSSGCDHPREKEPLGAALARRGDRVDGQGKACQKT